jgi:hypothetical protein
MLANPAVCTPLLVVQDRNLGASCSQLEDSSFGALHLLTRWLTPAVLLLLPCFGLAILRIQPFALLVLQDRNLGATPSQLQARAEQERKQYSFFGAA